MRKGGSILVIGDSTTFLRPSNPFQIYPQIIQKKIADAFAPVKIIHKGYGGIISSEFCTSANLQSLVQVSDVDLIMIGLGMNDVGKGTPVVADFGANFTRIIQYLRRYSRNAHVIICTPNTVSAVNFYGNKADSAFTPYRSQLDTVAAGFTNVSVCHFENAWSVAEGPTYSTDGTGVHPNDAGHSKLADLLWPIVQTGAWLSSLGK